MVRVNLVNPKKVLLPSLHIKLGLMNQFIKTLSKKGKYFKYLCQPFSSLSEAKLKEGVFNGLNIRKLMKDGNCDKNRQKKRQHMYLSNL